MPAEVREAFETKRQDILRAAQELFARYGLAKTTLDDIARAVGMKKASLYYYYASKEAIFGEVIRHESGELLRQEREEVGKAEHADEQLHRFMRARLAYMRSYVSLHGLAAQVILEVRPFIENLYQDLLTQECALLREIIEGGITHGLFQPCPAEQVADALLTVLHSVELMAVQDATNRPRAEIDYDAVEQTLTVTLRLLSNGLRCGERPMR